MTTLLYLAYGSNLLPARIRARLDDVRIRGTAELPGWDLRFHKVGADGSGKCNLIASPDSVAYGAIYEISVDARALLDEIEGVGRGYRGVTMALAGIGETYVYLAEETHIEDSLVPYDWYHAFVLEGARHHAFPQHYVQRIADVATHPDPDAQRRSLNTAVLHAAGSARLHGSN